MTGLLCSKDKDSNMNEDMPDTLDGFGYKFVDGKLKNVETGEPFQFVVREGDQSYNQQHYEALGEVLTEEIYKLLETECNLKRIPVPFDVKEEEASTFVFKSEDAFSNPDKLLILIHGSGVVRAGQWARRLIINDSIESGTQIPFIKEAQKEGYGVLVMNTNDNRRTKDGKRVKIRGSEDPESHAAHVWKNYVAEAEAKHIALIAHSYGGCVTTALFQEHQADFSKRVFAVAMTDSVHFISRPRSFRDLIKVSCNWVSSSKPLDTPLNTTPGSITRISAGVNVHEQTSWSSFRSVFKFLQKRYDAVMKGEDDLEKEEGKESTGGEDAAMEEEIITVSDEEDEGGVSKAHHTTSIESTSGEDAGMEEDSIPEEGDEGVLKGHTKSKESTSGEDADMEEDSVTVPEKGDEGVSKAHTMSDSDGEEEEPKK